MKTLFLTGIAVTLLVQPIAANAQFGLLAQRLGNAQHAGANNGKPSPLPGVANPVTAPSASQVERAPLVAQPGGMPASRLTSLLHSGRPNAPAGTSIDGFLAESMMSTKNVMIAAALLAQAVQDHAQIAGMKAYADQVQNCADPKALDAMKASLQSNIDTLNARKDLAGDVTAAYNAGDAQEKKLIGIAVANLALGIYRDVQLSAQAPGVISGIGTNPLLLTRIAQLKTAAGLMVLQSKGLISVGTALPKIMTAVRIAPPALAETTKPTDFAFN